MTNQRFEALSRMCLNNWHYIRHKVLSFNDGINFFTGHSGSGKSTVIDALQIVLYANTDGRGFFNKAAADDSDRSLIEYLRGMINIGEDNSVAAVLTPSVKKRFIRIVTERLVIGINHSFTRYVYSSTSGTYHFHTVHFYIPHFGSVWSAGGLS